MPSPPPGASGGVEMESTSYETDFEDLRKRLEDLKGKDRRRTLEQFSMIFPDVTLEETGVRHKTQAFSASPQQQGSPQQSILQAAATEGKITFETSNRRIKNFSASAKPANGELDYKYWRRAARRIAEDKDLPESQRKRIILSSLVGNAEDTIDPIRNESVKEILVALDKVYGSVMNGADLRVAFTQKYQTSEQSAGEYLNQLFVDLSEVIAADGASMDEMSEFLLEQFIRGTHDEDLLNKLRLEDKIDDPPTFPDLLASIRKEESKRTQRRLRHKKVTRSQMSNVECFPDTETKQTPTQERTSISNSKENEVQQLQQRISQLEKQVASSSLTTRPGRNVFCYRCGEDGHMATDCNNVANKVLVDKKMQARKERYAQKNPKK